MNKSNKFADILRNIMVRHTISSAVISILFCVALVIIINASVFNNLVGKFERQTLNYLDEMIASKSTMIDEQFYSVKNNMAFLQNEHQHFFENYYDYSIDNLDNNFGVHENGSYFKTLDNGGCALYYSNNVPFNDYTKDKALRTEWLDSSLRSAVEISNITVQSYFNSFDNMNRIYPFNDKLSEQYGSDLDMRDYNFYVDADFEHNPEKEIVWTSPYFDPAGQGWIVSCIAPIYNGNFLEGVSGVDLALNMIGNHILSIESFESAAVLLVEEHGLVVAQNDNAGEMLSLPVLEDIEGEIRSTIGKPDQFNLYTLEDKELSLLIKETLNTNQQLISYEDHKYFVIKSMVEETNWQLIAFIPYDVVEAEVIHLEKSFRLTFIVTLTVILVCIFVMTAIYWRKAYALAKRISEPIVALTKQLKDFGVTSFEVEPLPKTDIEEVDLLSYEFFRMAHDIRIRTNKLLRIQIEKSNTEKTLETYLKEATTDALTGLYNRRKIDDVLDAEVKRANRYHSVFSIMILDVDLFKDVNDLYGHHIGDDVLIGFSEILKENTRSSDFVARWGGDEFVIITVETKVDSAKIMGEKIRSAVETAELAKEIKVTTSIGIAEFDFEKDDARSLMRKADMALYEAKRRGKNSVVMYEETGEKHEI